MNQPLKIEAGKFYRTRDGRKVFIYATDAKGLYSIHGKIINGEAADMACNWIADGCAYPHRERNYLDLISEWHETPVAKFWPEFKWQAMDDGGAWYAFIEKPRWGENSRKWYPTLGSAQWMPKDQSPTFTGKPENSLIERKEGE